MFKSCKEIANILEAKFPTSLAEDYDNVGLLLGDPDAKVGKILICLDINEQVVEYAIKSNINMIISHHPILFKPIKSLLFHNYKNSLLYKLICESIAVYSLHTNFDNAEDGMNDILTSMIGLTNVQKLNPSSKTGRQGTLEQGIPLEQLCMDLKQLFNMKSIKLVGDSKEIVRQIAVVGGSGTDFLQDAIDAGCDVLITGDVKYHSALDALYEGISVIDAGHYNTEAAAMPFLAEQIESLTGLEVICSPIDSDPFMIV